MPYLRWKGIDINGATRKGLYYAQNSEELADIFLKKGIAIISSKEARHSFLPQITTDQKINILQELSSLLDAGILLPNTIKLLAEQTPHLRLQKHLSSMYHTLSIGHSFQQALENQDNLFEPFVMSILCAGEETGTLPKTCSIVASFLQMKRDFYNQLRSALIMPFITISFLVIAVLIIILFIIPQFNKFYISLGKEIPPSTKTLINIGTSLFSLQTFITGLFFISSIVLLWKKVKHYKQTKKFFEKILLSIPGITELIKDRLLLQFTQTLALLLQGGISLVDSLAILQKIMPHVLLKQTLSSLHNDILSGSFLSNSLYNYPLFFSPEMISLIALGEESETLPIVLEKLSIQYKNKFQQRLHRITVIINPLLMISWRV